MSKPVLNGCLTIRSWLPDLVLLVVLLVLLVMFFAVRFLPLLVNGRSDMKDNSSLHDSVNQTVSVPGRSSEIGSVLVSLLSCALSLAALAVSCTNLYTLLKLIRLLTPLLTVAQ